MSTYVSIGRNVNGKPMTEDKWRNFRMRLHWTVEKFTGPIVSVCNGTGTYQGVSEDTYIVVGMQNPSEADKEALTAALTYLSFKYDQESIALTIAEPHFIKPELPSEQSNAIANRKRYQQILD